MRRCTGSTTRCLSCHTTHSTKSTEPPLATTRRWSSSARARQSLWKNYGVPLQTHLNLTKVVYADLSNKTTTGLRIWSNLRLAPMLTVRGPGNDDKFGRSPRYPKNMHEQSRHLPELGRGQVTIETWAEKTTCATTRNKDMGGGRARPRQTNPCLWPGNRKRAPALVCESSPDVPSSFLLAARTTSWKQTVAM